MAGTEPLATVLLFSAVASFTALLGVLPQALVGRPSGAAMGWANALAGGLMLGVAYVLLTDGLHGAAAAAGLTANGLTPGPGAGRLPGGGGVPTDADLRTGGLVAAGVGALLGLAFVRVTHALTGTGELDLEGIEEAGPAYGYKVILVEMLHAGHEGVAIGAAMAVSLPLGAAMALTLAVHNIPEAMMMNAVLTQRGLPLRQAAVLSVAVNVNQVLLAVLAFAVAAIWPWVLPWVIGFAVGALLYLTLVELLPESYRQAGHTTIAVVTVIALGVVVLLAGAAT